MNRYISLVVFIFLVVGGGVAVGLGNPPGPWYAALAKPPFNPPNWIFAPVWTVLYVLIAIAGWRTWVRDRSSVAMKVWFAQMALNFAWSPSFFGSHRMVLALIVIALLWVAVVAFITTTRRTDTFSAWLFVPYLLWVSFAALLNMSLIILN